MSKYADLLKDPRWQKRRLEILSRDNWTCQFCNATEETLHVHHHSYEGKKYPWEVADENLITLCHECHSVAEKFKKFTNKSSDLIIKIRYNNDVFVVCKAVVGKCIARFNRETLEFIDFYNDDLVEFIYSLIIE